MNEFWQGLVTIALAVTGIATLAVIVSKNSNTAGVLQAAANGLGTDIGAAVSPVTGSGFGGVGSILGGTSLSGGAGSVLIQ